MLYLNIIFLLFIMGLMFYKRSSLLIWAGFLIAYMLALSFYGNCPIWFLILLWPVVLGILAILGIPSLRKPLITSWAFSFAKKQLPTITASESEALKSGTVSWDGELFSGAPNWKSLYAYEPAKLSQEEREFLDGPVEELCKNKYSKWDMWHKDLNYRPDMVKFAKENGFFGLIIPKEYGGKEFSVLATWQAIMKLGRTVGPLGTWIGIANSIGAGELVDRYGTKEQKEYFLPRLARGDETPCFALTSPIAGSDATSIEDTGIICKGEFEGKEVIGVRLNFNKRYITLGNEATIMSLAFRMYDPEHLLGDVEDIGITLALVPTSLKGVTHGRRHYPIGLAFPNGPLQGKDVFIPIDNIVGGREGAGKAWTMLTQVLATGRATSLPTGAITSAKYSFYTTAVYCGIRKQFGLPVGAFESVQEKLAELAGFTYISDATRLLTFAQIQAGERPAIPAAISKYNSTELARQCAIHAVDLQGGKAVMNGPNNLVADLYTGAPMPVTVEGSNTMTRGLIVFGQGAVRCHPYIISEMQALQKDDKNTFDKLVMKHINFTISNHVRALVLGLTGGRIAPVPGYNKSMKKYLRQLTRLSAAFSLLSDVAMMSLGGKLKRMEALSGRLADVFSMLYMTTASIKHFHDKGYPVELQPVVEWSNQWALNIAEQKLSEVLDNFPNTLLRGWLRLFIFPLGRRIKGPSDKLTLQVGSLTQSSKTIREVIAEGIFLTPTDDNPISLLEEALAETHKVSDINKRLQLGVRDGSIKGHTYFEQIADALKNKVITKPEEAMLMVAHTKIMKIINVDDFSLEELHKQK
jgi:acyl-CoA dehydrogenase